MKSPKAANTQSRFNPNESLFVKENASPHSNRKGSRSPAMHKQLMPTFPNETAVGRI
jgi:hypothetical protein